MHAYNESRVHPAPASEVSQPQECKLSVLRPSFLRFAAVVGAGLILLCFAIAPAAEKHHSSGDDHGPGHHHGSGEQQHPQHGHHHRHANWEPPPPEYSSARSTRWDDAAASIRGQQLFQIYCMVCHGTDGKGTGPAAKGLPHPPADLTNHFHRAPGDGDAYLFWRVSEGGQVEPFKSMQSAMPAFKTVLTEEQRWDVLAYVHTQFHGGFTSEAMAQSVTGEGKVIAVVPASAQLVVEHGVIQGFMDAMTMGYKVTPPSLLDGFKAGDTIRFTIDTQNQVIVKLEKLHN